MSEDANPESLVCALRATTPTQPPPMQSYDSLPFYRRSGPASALLVVVLVMFFVAPPLLIVAPNYGPIGTVLVGIPCALLTYIPLLLVSAALLSGNIYYKFYHPTGRLVAWGWGNKIIAALFVCYAVSSFLTGSFLGGNL